MDLIPEILESNRLLACDARKYLHGARAIHKLVVWTPKQFWHTNQRGRYAEPLTQFDGIGALL